MFQVENPLRKLAPQRSVSLFVDQEEFLCKLIEEKGLPKGTISVIVRQGVDLAIDYYKKRGIIND